MIIIRYANEKDIDYIHNILNNYNLFFKKYIKIILNKLILNKNIVSCLIAESNNEIIGFDINILNPYTFWNNIYKNLNFIEKYKYIRDNNKTSNYNYSNIDSPCKDVINNLYTTQNKTAYTLFYYNNKKNENIRGFILGIIQIMILKDIKSEILYQSAEIKKDNISSIESYKKRGFNKTHFSHLPYDTLFALINLKEIENELNTFNFNGKILL